MKLPNLQQLIGYILLVAGAFISYLLVKHPIEGYLGYIPILMMLAGLFMFVYYKEDSKTKVTKRE